LSVGQVSSDSYLVGGWQASGPSPSGVGTVTEYLVFNSDQTFSGLIQNTGVMGSYSVDQSRTPWWLDFTIVHGAKQTFVPCLYSHPSGGSDNNNNNNNNNNNTPKQLTIAGPFPSLSIFLGSPSRPSSLVNGTTFFSLPYIPSFTTTTTTTGSQTTGFGVSGGTTFTNCPDCVNGCAKMCNLQDVGRKKCQAKCKKIQCGKVC